jgi:hypothetical protein
MPTTRQQDQERGPSPTNQSTNTHENGETSTSSSSSLDDWKQRPPYEIHRSSDSFNAVWNGSCHCGKTRYQLSRKTPLASKYCHCTTCQRLHGSPFQWAAIFHKTDINFTHGHHDLAWYDPSECTTRHKLPCKVSCAYCRTPIMDEGRNMILLFPTLIDGINSKEGREAFKATCHMFYSRRVVDIRDGAEKWDGLNGDSDRLDEDGNVMQMEGGGEENKHQDVDGDREKKRQKTEERRQENAN